MGANEYHFIDHWRVRSTVEEITGIIRDSSGYERWWPSVYLKMKKTKSGNPDGTGERVKAVVKGWLPYTLRLLFNTTETNHPYGFALDVTGDFAGRGIWTFEQDGNFVNITYDWKIRADHPLLKHGSAIMKPLFESNHHWCMRKGEESLKLELARRHAGTDQERQAVPGPPGPVSNVPWVVVGVGLALVIMRFLTNDRR